MGYNRTLGHFTNSTDLATIWAANQTYQTTQLVLNVNNLYKCVSGYTNTGTSFATDLAAGKWVQVGPTTTAGDLIVNNGTDAVRFPVGSDGQVLVVDTTQTNKVKWATVSQGAKNYINYGTFENNATTGWSLSNSTLDATTKLPNQASGSWTAANANLSIASVGAGNQLAGSYSLSLASTTATVAGNMLVSDTLTLDKEAQASVQTFSFFYKVASGASNGNFSGTSSNSFGVAVYVVDGASAGTWIQPAGVFNIVQSSLVGKASGTFQMPSDATQVRLAVYFPNATAGAITLYLDDFVLGPQVVQYGAPVTDWTAFTGTSSWTGTLNAWEKRIGDSADYRFYLSLTATPTGELTFNLPSGRSIDTNKILGIGQDIIQIGRFKILRQTVNYWSGDVVIYATSGTAFKLRFPTSAGATSPVPENSPVTATSPATFASGDYIEVEILNVPIQGWASGVSVSNDTDTRIVDFAGSQTTQAVTANVTNISFTTIKDSHGSWSTSQYSVPVSGDYLMSGSFISSIAGTAGDVYKNGVRIGAYLGASAYTPGAAAGGSALITGCVAGDLITLRSTQTATITSGYLSIHRLSGPSVVAATETVAASYYCSATVGASATVPINFDAKEFDTHNAVTTSSTAWKFTTPVSGTYHVTLVANLSGTATWINIFKNGSLYKGLSYGGSTSNAFGSTVLKLNAGDYIDIRTVAAMNFAGGALNTDISNLTIVRMGN